MITSFADLQPGYYIYYLTTTTFTTDPTPRYGCIKELTPKNYEVYADITSPFTNESYFGTLEGFFTIPSDEAYSSLTDLQAAHPELFI